jgi:hypothetical protein
VISLCGCSAGPVIERYAADYRETTASAGDAQLLLNILRAKDDLPIHFSDLSLIHGAIQLTAAGAAVVPVVQNGSLTPTTVLPTVGVQSSPTFDMGTLDTQDFTKGMLSPIDPRIIKQLFDQGVDPRILMLLFFSEYQTPRNERLLNNMACDLSRRGAHPERGCWLNVYNYLGAINSLFRAKGLRPLESRQQLRANIYVVLKPIGGPLAGGWSLSQLGDLRQIDPAKYRLEGKQLYSISEPRLAICYERNHVLHPLFDDPSPTGFAACNKGEVRVAREAKAAVALPIRSTYELLQYLGQILRFQEEKSGNRCLALDEIPDQRRCDTGEVLFQVNAPAGTPVVATRYAGEWYSLNQRSCNKLFQNSCDYSLQVLAILELLINANKIAKDIPSTPRVQVVP